MDDSSTQLEVLKLNPETLDITQKASSIIKDLEQVEYQYTTHLWIMERLYILQRITI